MFFKNNMPEISVAGDYRFKIIDVIEIRTKKGEEKIVVKVRPYDMDTDTEYAEMQIWFNAIRGDRENSFLDALDNPTDFESMIGKYFGGTVSFYEKQTDEGTKTYTNVNDFFPVDQEPLAYATVAGIRRDLNVFLRKAVELKYIVSNPVEGTKLTKPRKNLDEEKTEVLSKGQVKQLLEFVKGTPEELHYSLMIDASLRRGEATGLLWSDVDFDNSCIKIRNNWVEGMDGAELTTPKTQSSVRTVKLTDYTMELLQREFLRYKKCRMLNKNFVNSNRVVYQKNGKPMLPKSYYRKFKRTLKKAGLPDISMHDLRHTSITLQIEAGANIKSVSHRAGHSDTQITSNVYTHCTHAMDEETVNIMTDILSNAG